MDSAVAITDGQTSIEKKHEQINNTVHFATGKILGTP